MTILTNHTFLPKSGMDLTSIDTRALRGKVLESKQLVLLAFARQSTIKLLVIYLSTTYKCPYIDINCDAY